MKASADNRALEEPDGVAALGRAQGSAPAADAAVPLAAPAAVAAASSGTGLVGTTMKLEPDVERKEPAPPEQQPPVLTSAISPGPENEAAVVLPCHCGENGSRDRSGSVHLQIYRIHVDTINAGPGDTDTQRHQEKTFLMWLMDEEHLEDHAMFLTSVVFCGSLIMMLTFAWLEADLALASAWWLWAGLLSLLLMVQTCTWMAFAMYSLWLYPKAYFRWKAEPQVPLRRPRSASRHRHRRRHRSRSSGSRSRNSTATQTQPVLDSDQRA